MISQYKRKLLDLNEPLELYRCLNRKGFIFSVRQKGLVVGHTSDFVLKNCNFIINKKQRYICTKTRNVHAFIKGYIGTKDDITSNFSFILKYDPYINKGFTVLSEEINNSKIVYLQENKILCQL